MRRWATKSPSEREDAEVERLVRPAPKQKPPRRDKQRNRVDLDNERDPDQEADKDLSQNYKDVGGSIGGRVVRRYVEAHLAQRIATRYLIAKGDRVPARSKETGKVVMVSPETLKERADEYDPVEEEEDVAQKDDPESEELAEPREEGRTEVELSDKQRSAIEKKIKEAEKEWQAWDDWNTRQQIEAADPDELEEQIARAEKYESGEGADDDDSSPKDRVYIEGVGAMDVNTLKGILQAKKPNGPEPEDDPTGMTPDEWVESYGLPSDEDLEEYKEPKDESKEPKDESKEPKDESKEPKDESKEPKEKPGDPSKKPKEKDLSEDRRRISDLSKKIKGVPEVPDLPDLEEGEDDADDADDADASDASEEFSKAWSAFYTSIKGIVSEFASLLPSSPVTEALRSQVSAVEDFSDAVGELKDHLKGKDLKKDHLKGKDLKKVKDTEKKIRKELKKGEAELAKKTKELHSRLDDADGAESVAKQLGIKDPPRPPVQPAEVEEALHQATGAFGESGARRLLEQGYHPQDIQSLVSTFESDRAEVKNLGKYIKGKGADHFEVNPDRVKPPTTWEKDGKEVSFAELSDEEQAEAYRKHQMQVVGLSLAAQSNVAVKVMESGVPEPIAEAVARMALTGGDAKKAESLGRKLFDTAMSSGRVGAPDRSTALKTMEALKGTAGATAMAGFLQANDYHTARHSLLEDPKTRITEKSRPKEIAEKLSGLNDLIRVPTGVPDYGAATMLRTQVLGKLRTLDPEKYEKVREDLNKLDAKAYEKSQKSWEVDHSEWSRRKQEHEQKQDTQQQKGYREKVEDRVPFDEPEPLAPKKPPTLGEGDAADKVQKRMAFRVARRFISTYPLPKTMGLLSKNRRQAVYHGTEPTPVDPYPQWSQANPSDLEGDGRALSSLLKRARQWLKEKVIAQMARDDAMRAALDYAIEEHGLLVSSNIYHRLLARLAGENSDQYGGATLVARTQGVKEMSTKLASTDVPVIEESLTRLDKMAKWIQDNHQAWGLDFKVAKTLVNGLDKVADHVEKVAFGEVSMIRRQAEVLGLKQAEVIEQVDSDEPYMDAFDNTMDPIQTDSDEPYMAHYDDDQSSAVGGGKDSTGRPLAPHYG